MKFYIDKKWWKISWLWLSEYLTTLKDGIYRLEIVRDYKARSIPQNNLFHGWMLQLEKKSHVWYTAEEWKELFKTNFLSTKHRNILDRRKKITRTRSTTELSTKEFNEFLEKIQEAWKLPHIGVKLEFPDNFSWGDSV